MSEVTRKSLEVIKAQISTFAAERVEHYQDSGHIFNNLGDLALAEAKDVTRVTTSTEYHKGEVGNNYLRIPVGTKRTVATAADYKDFLRSVGGSRYETIQGRAEMLKEYVRFEPKITTLLTELADPAKRKEHPNFLGNGSNAMVFSITEEDKSYAVRVPNGRGIDSAAIDSHIAGAVLGKGIPHLEQIVAASYKDGVTVAEVMPGREVGHLTPNEIRSVTDEQLGKLVDTLAAVSEHGIEIDPKPSNFFYDPKEGYGIVDYHSSKVAGKISADQDFAAIVGWMATVIDNAGFYGKPYSSKKTPEDYVLDLKLKKANLGLLERYRSVVESKLTGEAQQTALAEIDKHIFSGKEEVENYSNPEWVAERIAQEQKRKRRRIEHAMERTKDGWITLDTV